LTWPERAPQAPPCRWGPCLQAGRKGHNINENSFPGSPALGARSFTAIASSTFQNATESFRSFFRTAEGVYVPFVITPNLALKSIFLGLWNPASVFAVSIRVEEKENLLRVAKPARGFPLSKSRSIRVLRVFAFMTELVSNFFFGGLVITDLGETKMRLLNSGRIEIPI